MEVSLAAIELIDAAVHEYPEDAGFWHQRATLIQLGPGSEPHTLEDALASYFTALCLDPGNQEIMEDIGHFFDAVLADERRGRRWFARARRMKSGQPSKCRVSRDMDKIKGSKHWTT